MLIYIDVENGPLKAGEMSQSSLLTDVTALVDAIVSNQTVPVIVGGINFVLRFSDGYNNIGGNQIFDAQNVIVSLINFGRSSSATQYLQQYSDSAGMDTILVTINNDLGQPGSHSGSLFPLININTSDVAHSYMTTEGNYEHFVTPKLPDHSQFLD